MRKCLISAWLFLSLLCSMLITNLGAQPPFSVPAPTCPSGTNVMLWSQTVNPMVGTLGTSSSTVVLICNPGGQYTYTIPPGLYPSLLTSGVPVLVNVLEVVSYDGYVGRTSSMQDNERWRIVFKKSASIVATTGYTPDLMDGVEETSWIGPLGSFFLPMGADEVVLEHWCVGNPASSPESVVPASLCLSVSACPADCPTTIVIKN